MKMFLLLFGLGLASLAPSVPCFAQSMTVDSLDGAVTTNEINSFKSYILTLTPATWSTTTGMENEYAQGHSGENVKAMGLMYEISGDTAILDRMIYFCDTLLSQRNDLLAAPNGQLTYNTGTVAPAWPSALTTTPIYSTSASGDCAGHLANCARLILQTPAIWNTNVAIGDPNGYGVTYLQRAVKYVAEADQCFSQYFFPYMLDTTQTYLTYNAATAFYMPGNQLPWNQQMMMTYPMQNLAIAHAIMGDNAALVSKYDGYVQTNLGRFMSDPSVRISYADGDGNTAYNWSYTPTADSGEDSNHESLDVAGFCRAYSTGRYSLSAAQMTPFANMICDVMTLTVGTSYSGVVDGTSGTGHAAGTTYLRSGYFLAAEFRPDQYYNLAAGLHLAAGSTTSSTDAFSRLMWIKNKRYLGSQNFTLAASPSSQSVTAGSGTSYTLTATPQNGFTGSIGLSLGGLPTGASGSFSPASIAGGSGASILSVTTTGSTVAGSYPGTVTGTSGSLSHTAAITLVVLPDMVATPAFSPSAGTYTSAQVVSVSTATTGASIRYTLDGSTPSEMTGTVYASPVSIGTTATLKAMAYKSGMTDSAIASGTYSINLPAVSAPTFSPAGGSYSAAQSVALSSATAGASIRFTTDGSTPSETAGTLYASAIPVTTSATIRAIAYKSGMTDSAVASASYTIGAAPSEFSVGASAVTASSYHTGYPPANTVDGNLSTRWACSGDGCWIQYDLGAVATVDYVDIAWYLGNARIYTFDIQVSSDASIWTTVLASQASSGTTTALEQYNFAATTGRYVRIVGHQSNVDEYTNIDELQIWGSAGGSGTTFAITASVGANGTISPAGTVTVAAGASQSFTLTPNSGYAVATVTVDGSSAGAVTSYTFTNVTSNHSISATFTAAGGDSNLAPTGTAYGWSAMTSGTANTGKVAHTGLNDGNLTTDVDLDSAGDSASAWEGAGVVWSTAKSFSSAKFINGTVTSGGDGFLTANCKLQFSTDGSTWVDSGWTLAPAYPYSASASAQTYTFSGASVTGKLAARVVGQVRTTDTSYHWIVKEVEFIGH